MFKSEMPIVPESPRTFDTITSVKELLWPVDYNGLIEKTEDKSLESTRRMVQLIEEANEFGVQSLTHLDEQDEKLHRIECELTDIDEEMEIVKEDIFHMVNFCKLCRRPCEFWNKRCGCIATCKYYDTEEGSSWQSEKKVETGVVSEQPTIRLRKDTCRTVETPFFKKVSNDAKEEEMNANMRNVEALLKNLKGIALDINTELNLQKPIIENVDRLVTSNDVAMGSNSKRLTKLQK